MRRTGKLYMLTLVSCAMAILASVLASLWNEHTSAFHLWVDLIPQGFGMASFITSTLIVGLYFFSCVLLCRAQLRCAVPYVAGDDRRRLQGGHVCCYWKYVVLLAIKYDF